MKTPLQVIQKMVKDHPKDMTLGSKVRHYIIWLNELSNGKVSK